jgi:hypothetical protein
MKQDDMRCVQDPMIAEKKPLPMDDKILAIEYKKGCQQAPRRRTRWSSTSRKWNYKACHGK